MVLKAGHGGTLGIPVLAGSLNNLLDESSASQITILNRRRGAPEE